jgi:ribosomal protein L7/L12
VDTIAYLRKITGLGLKDAMDAVDYYSNRHPGSII